MKKQDSTIDSKDLELSFTVDQTPQQVFEAITDTRGWWGRNIEGGTHKQGDEFVYRYGDLHFSRHRLTEVVPNQKIVWQTTDSRLSFVDTKDEWTGTTITFEISEKDGKTLVRFTHTGLTPVLECFTDCSGAWGYFIEDSLRSLITTGKGKPDPTWDN